MTGLTIKRIGKENLDILVQSRIDYCMRDKPPCTQDEYSAFESNVRQWTLENATAGNYYGYAGYAASELVCFAGILLYVMPPILRQTNRKIGHVFSFFTYPQHRRLGVGDELMKHIVKDAKELGITQLVLNATPMGEGVYLKNGFSQPAMKYMSLEIV